MSTLTLGIVMLKGTSSRMTTLVKFIAITSRDTAGLQKAWLKGVLREKFSLINRLLLIQNSWWMTSQGKGDADFGINNENSHRNNKSYTISSCFIRMVASEGNWLVYTGENIKLLIHEEVVKKATGSKASDGGWVQPSLCKTTWYLLSKAGLVSKAPKSINLFFRIFACGLAETWALQWVSLVK